MGKERFEEDDPNYIAYKAMETELKEKYLGKCVAFFGGQLILIEDNMEALFQKADEANMTEFFCHEITESKKVYRVGGPRVIKRRLS